MKRLIIMIVAASMVFTAFSQTSLKVKHPDLTQSQWETFMDGARNYQLSKLQNSPDSTAKFSALVSAYSSIAGRSESYLEDKMEEFYGSDWKNAGGPVHAACQMLCSIIYYMCVENVHHLLPADHCSSGYRSCMQSCGLLPQGL